jgi:hypothetical protein
MPRKAVAAGTDGGEQAAVLRELDGANDVITVRAPRHYRWMDIDCMIPDPAGAAVLMISRDNYITAH